ncbi:hypothetical protein MIND_00771200 [Mycena indigotica]|uniref:Hepatocellular carcinoma-associated antigen 59-domain-containing protein n=1 Tax=Mycena indigotica TaxID=2126181 RepID=A0A8H6SN27_9AGAR|nr:uncharacterized protein MIND_00771200 [Mycena indigotica]KAF7302048.1 hypothetical protein MIND_00771200 [Mycena indigotica]
MIKKRSRPQQGQRVREKSPPDAHLPAPELDEDDDTAGPIDLNDLIELRKLRKARQGIDAAKLTKGDAKRRKRPREEDEVVQAGLRPGFRDVDDDEDRDEDDIDARARRAVRANNFTQQTNALDVDKHMMAYIEANLTVRSRPRDEDTAQRPADPQEALYTISDRWKVDKSKPTDDGSVTNSAAMLTAIPEVDLGMDSRLKNIEDTEKAKRDVAEGKQVQNNAKVNPEEAHLVASRFYRPGLKMKSDTDILRDAKLEAMGLPVPAEQPRQNDSGAQLATDDVVMERFKKRMRK